jgi:hypothetical protein
MQQLGIVTYLEVAKKGVIPSRGGSTIILDNDMGGKKNKKNKKKSIRQSYIRLGILIQR